MQNQTMIETWIQYTHLEKLYGYLPGMDEGLLARLFWLGVEEYREVKGRFDANARDAARELLEEPGFAGRIDRLPFRSGETVVGVGDSITDDLQSWLEIVRHLLERRRPQDGIRVVNGGLSAHTTAMVLRRFVPSVVAQEPDWIICLLGGNDATRVGPEPNKTQVSPEETSKNLEAMRRIAGEQTEAEWVWITPPTYDEQRASSFPLFKMGQSVFGNDDIVAVGDLVRAREDTVVDIQAVFGLPAAPELQGPDGVHPSLAGQKAIARAFVERLTESSGEEEKGMKIRDQKLCSSASESKRSLRRGARWWSKLTRLTEVELEIRLARLRRPDTRISTPQSTFWPIPLHPPPLYKGEYATTGHTTDQRRAGGARNDRPRGAETAPRGALARGGAVPPEEGCASDPQEIGHLPVGLDRDVGTDKSRRPLSQVLPNAEEHRLGPGEDGMDEPRGTYPTNLGSSIPARRTRPEDRSSDHFSAPLGSSKNGRLRFTNGAHRVVIRAGSHLRGLYRASFEERMPIVVVRGSEVSIRYTRIASCDWTGNQPDRPAEVALNAGIPWDLEVRGGASRLLADLSGLRLGSLKVEGGTSRLEVVLPVPSGVVTVVILGGASNVAIRRPEGVAARLRVDGGATNLTFDDRHIGAAGGEQDLQSSGDYDGAADRYDIAVTGGANNFSIDRQRGWPEGAYFDREGE